MATKEKTAAKPEKPSSPPNTGRRGQSWKVVDLGNIQITKAVREAAGWGPDEAGRDAAEKELRAISDAAIKAHLVQYEAKADDAEEAELKKALAKIEARKKARATQENVAT